MIGRSLNKVKIKCAVIKQTCQYDNSDGKEHKVTQVFRTPLGMVCHLEGILKTDKCCYFSALPAELKEDHFKAKPFL